MYIHAYQSSTSLACLEASCPDGLLLVLSHKPLSGAWVEGYIDIASRKGMAPNDVTNADACVTLVKDYLEWFSVSPNFLRTWKQ